MPDVIERLPDVPLQFQMCPLHPRPERLMSLVVWAGEEATCSLCGFTRSEHTRRLKAALAVLRGPGGTGGGDR